MMKRIFALVILLVLCSVAFTAQAAQKLFDQVSFLEPFHLLGTISTAASKDCIYRLMDTKEVYCWQMDTGDYSYFGTVPALPDVDLEIPLSKQPEEMQQTLMEAVYSLTTDENGNLYGINHLFGRVCLITPERTEWLPVTLDASVINTLDSAYPPSLTQLWITNETLYGFYDLSVPTRTKNFAPTLLSFSLVDGHCTVTQLPNTVTLCPYQPGQVLLLQSDASGALSLHVYTLSTGESVSLPQAVPVNIPAGAYLDFWDASSYVGGLAYDVDRDVIYLASATQLWLSRDGHEFAQSDDTVEWSYLTPTSNQAWVLQNGAYAFKNGAVYLVE